MLESRPQLQAHLSLEKAETPNIPANPLQCAAAGPAGLGLTAVERCKARKSSVGYVTGGNAGGATDAEQILERWPSG